MSPTCQVLQPSARAQRRGVKLGLAQGTTVGSADPPVRGESAGEARRIGPIGPIESPVHEPEAYAVGWLLCGLTSYQHFIARINRKCWHCLRCKRGGGADAGENRWSVCDLFG
jgi:hypothetical protein